MCLSIAYLSLTGLDLVMFVRLAHQGAPTIRLSQPPYHQDYKYVLPCLGFLFKCGF